MTRMSAYTSDEPIAAIATAPGRGAIGVIRVSGREVVRLVAKMSSVPQRLLDAPGYTAVHGVVRSPDAGESIDEVLFLVFREPHSYTGEESIEIQGHGSPAGLEAILDALSRQGIRRASPGEFTFRAFINGKLDLTRAEAVNELVNAQTDAARRLAMQRLSGAVFHRIAAARDRLAEVMASLAAQIDYPDEETGEIPMEVETVREVRGDLQRLRASYATGRLYQEGALVVIAGRTNAGKSSLFNALLREDRAIVSEIHGTTRDYLEVSVSMDGIPTRLVDTAGLRESEETIESEGIRRSRELLKHADAAIYVVDGLTGLQEADTRELSRLREQMADAVVPVLSKIDLPGCVDPAEIELSGHDGEAELLPVSPISGAGIRRIPPAVAAEVTRRRRSAVEVEEDVDEAPEEASKESAKLAPTGGGEVGAAGDAVIDSARQRDLLDRAIHALDAVEEAMDATMPADAVAVDVQDALGALGEITGEVSSSDILDLMFGSFCLGK
jgi:tRNA modification GTPase